MSLKPIWRNLFVSVHCVLFSIAGHAAAPDGSAAWLAKTAVEPENALAFFNLAVTYHKEQKFSSALKAYERVIKLGSPLAPVARFYEAQIFETTGEIEKAKAALQAISIEMVPVNLRRNVLLMKNRIFLGTFADENVTVVEPTPTPAPIEKVWAGFAELTYGQNSNPQTLSDVSSNSISSDLQTQLKAGLSYQPSASSIHDIKLSYTYSGTFFAQQASSNYAYHDVVLPSSLYFDAYRIKLTPEFFADTYGSESFSRSLGANLELTRRLDALYLSLSAQHQQISNLTSSYSYLTGFQEKAQLAASSQWSTSRLFITGYGGRLSYQDTSTLVSSYGFYGATVGYSQFFLPWDVTLLALLENHIYGRASSDTLARSDQKTLFNLQLGFLLMADLRASIDVTSVNNDSNFSSSTNNRVYKQVISLLGLSYSF